MAKKVTKAEEPTFAQAVRSALGVVGGGGRDQREGVKKWITDNHPALAPKLEGAGFNTALANARKKLGMGRGESPVVGSSAEPTLTDLLAARSLCADMKMSPRQLHELAAKLNQFGSLSNLAKCLEALEQLSAK